MSVSDEATTHRGPVKAPVPQRKYSSSFSGKETDVLVGCGVYPVKACKATRVACPAPVIPLLRNDDHEEPDSAFEDIIDEVLYYLKARLLLKAFPLDGPADRTSLYLTLYLQSCIRHLWKQRKPLLEKDARVILQTLATERSVAPGDATYPFNAMHSSASLTPEVSASLKDYLKLLRLEAGSRLVDRMWAYPEGDGGPNKYWLPFARKDFLGHMLEL